jgi:acetoacetate decarboxylase
MLYALTNAELDRLRGRRLVPHFSGAEMLFATYRTDPGVVRKILPNPLDPPRDPLATVFVARYPETNFGCIYNEGALFLHAEHKGEHGLYCLSMPVDDDTALIAGREQLGFPKKMAEIALHRSEDEVVGTVTRKGTEILRIEADLSERAVPSSELERLGQPSKDWNDAPCTRVVSHLFKFFPSPDAAGFDYLPRLIRQVTLLRPREGTRLGTGSVTVTSSSTDPLGEVPVREVVGTFHGVFDNTMLPGRVVRRTWNPFRFARHAFFKTDVAPALLAQSRSRTEANVDDRPERLARRY